MRENGKAFCDRCGKIIPITKRIQLCKECNTWLENYVKEKREREKEGDK